MLGPPPKDSPFLALDRAWPLGRRWPEDLLSDEIAILLLRYGARIVAERREMCERTLRRGFQRRGVRLAEHLRSRRRILALRFLATDLAFETVAHRLGFASTQVLSRFVRRELGTTATALRESLRRC